VGGGVCYREKKKRESFAVWIESKIGGGVGGGGGGGCW